MTPGELEILALSVRVALAATLVTLPFALGIAWALSRRWPGRAVLDAAVHLPLVLPPVVTGYALLLAFAPGGWLSGLGPLVLFRWQGAALAAAVMSLPLLVRPMRQAFEAVDPRLPAAARTLGASPWRAFRTVTLPLALPGVLAGSVLGFAKALGEFGATITFAGSVPGETRTLPLAVYAALQSPDGDAAAGRLAGLAVIVAVGALAASEYLARRTGRHRL